jgi:hypothetical protein
VRQLKHSRLNSNTLVRRISVTPSSCTVCWASSAGRLERFACLPSPWTFDDFDFTTQPSVDKKLMTELGTLRFLEDATNCS